MFIESPIPPTFLPIEIELNRYVIRVQIQFYSTPPVNETLIYHLMDLLIFYLAPYHWAEWNLVLIKFSVLPYVKEILADNKHLKQPPSLWKRQFRNRMCSCLFTCKDAWGVHSINIRVGGCCWSSKILITFIPCFKAKVRPINIPIRDQSLKIYTYLYTGV